MKKHDRMAGGRLPRRLLSIALAAALVAGLVGLGGLNAGAATSAQKALETTAATTARLTFQVPETIWLKQSTTATGTTSTIEAWSNIGSASGTSAAGSIYFNYVVAGTPVKLTRITCDKITGANVVPGCVGKATSSDVISATAVNVSLSPKGTDTATWTAYFTIGDNPTEYTAKAYSVIWAPSTTVGYVAKQSQSTGGTSRDVRTGGILGAIGLNGNNLGTGALAAYYTAWANKGPFAYGGWGTNGLPNSHYVSANQSTDGQIGSMVVDTRFSGGYDIPGFYWAFVVTRMESLPTSNTILLEADYIWANADPNGNNRTSSSSNNGIQGLRTGRSSMPVNYPTATAYLRSRQYSRNRFGTSATETTTTMTMNSSIAITWVDKTTLRSNVVTAEGGRLPDQCYTQASIDAYYAALSAATVRLGTPNGTNNAGFTPTALTLATGMSATVNCYYNADNSAMDGREYQDGVWSNADSLAYAGGDKIVVTAPAFKGWTLVRVTTNSGVASPAPSGGAYTETIGVAGRQSALATPNWNFYYEPNTFTVTYNVNGGNPAPNPITETMTYDFSTKYVSTDVPTLTGYTFTGWKISGTTNGTDGDIYWANNLLSNKLNCDQGGQVFLTATWVPNKYKVAFDPGPGSGGGDRTVTYDGYYNADVDGLGLPSATRTGYTFGGWWTGQDADGNGTGTQIVSNITKVTNATMDPSKSPTETAATFYAKWNVNTYQVIFNHSGGTLGGAPSHGPFAVIYDTNYNAVIPAGLPVWPGWEFDGWWGGMGAVIPIVTGTPANSGTIDTVSGNPTTFVAKWKTATYTFIFNFEGGDIAGYAGPHTMQGIFGAGMPGPTPNPTLTGYIFKGWFTEIEGTDTQLIPGDATMGVIGVPILSENSVADPAVPTTYHARWEPRDYSIIWSLEGGLYSGAPSNPTTTGVLYNDKYELPAHTPTRDDYNFGGWWTEPNGGGVQIFDGAPVTAATLSALSMSVTGVPTVFYAKWMFDGTYTVTYDLQGGNIEASEAPVSFDVPLDAVFTYPDNIPDDPEMTGYEFKGWFTQPGGGGLEIIDGVTALNGSTLNSAAVADYTEPTVFHAHWAPLTYNIKFDPKNGEAVIPADVVYGTKYVLPAEPAWAGYVFAGWWTTEVGAGDEIDGTTDADYHTLAVDEDPAATFYARWTPIEYTLHYDDNGAEAGELGRLDKTVIFGDAALLLPPVITKEGYILASWEVLNSNNGYTTNGPAAKPAGDMRTTPGTVTLKAVWTPDDVGYNVRVYLANAAGAYGAAEPDMPESGFTGAVAVADPTDYADPALYVFDAAQANKLSETIRADGKTVLVLHYQRAKVTLTVDLVGGAGSLEGILGSFPWGSEQFLPEPKKQGWKFDGWTITGTGALPNATEDGVIMGTAATTATAKWIEATDVAYGIDVYLEGADGNYQLIGTIPGAGTTGTKVELAGDGSEWVSPEAAYYAYNSGLSDTEGIILEKGDLKLELYFDRKLYPLSVDRNGGTGGSGTPSTGIGLVGNYPWGAEVELEEPTRAGYTFLRWSGVSVTGDGKVIVDKAATTAVAQWAADDGTDYFVDIFLQKPDGTYELTPDRTFNETGVTDDIVTVNAAYLGDPLYPAIDSGKANVLSAPITVDGKMRLTMYLLRKTVALTVIDAGYDDPTAVTPVPPYRSGQTVYITNPTREGYSLTWLISNDAVYNDIDILTGTLTLGSGDTTITAQWTPNDVGYKVAIYKENESGVFVLTETQDKTGVLTGETAVAVIAADPYYVFDASQPNKLNGVVTGDGKLTLEVYYKRVLVPLSVEGVGYVGSYPWGSTQEDVLDDSWQPTAPIGMEFDHWAISEGGAGAKVSVNDVTLGEDLTGTVVKAMWKPSTAKFQVEIYTQNAAGGYDYVTTAIGPAASQPDAITDAPYTITSKLAYNPNPASYLNTAPASPYADLTYTESIEADGSSTFRLYYPRHTVILTVDLDSGTAGSPGGIAAGTSVRLWGAQVDLGANPTRENYTFGGWSILSGTGAYFIGGDLVVGTADTAIKANWIRLAESVKRYTVDVYLQQADGSYALSANYMKINRNDLGEITGTATAAGSEWSGAGYAFVDGHPGNVLSAGILGDNLTTERLQLHYARTPVTLAVELDGGTAGVGGIAAGSYRWGQVVPLGTNPTKAGCLFSHWIATEGAGAGIAGDALTLGTTATTIMAVWIEDPVTTYKVIYEVEVYLMNANGDYVGVAPLKILKSALIGPDNAEAAAGDWSGAGYAYESGALKTELIGSYNTADPLVLYYKRTAGGYAAYRDFISSDIIAQGAPIWGSVITLDPAPTKAGYQFVCWQHTAGTGSLVNNVLTVGVGDVVEALWIADSVINGANYKVYIFLQQADGTYAAAADTFVVKTGITGPGNASSAAGDWSGAGYEYASGAVPAADLGATGTTSPVLELRYKRTLVDLTVNLGGGAGGTASQAGLRWGQEIALANPTREGYTFSYWRVTAGDGAGITAGNTLILGATDTAIEAVWTENGGPGPGPGPDHSGCKLFGKCKVTGGCAMFGCKLPGWLSPFLHVGTFLLGFGAGWVTRAATMPWWILLLILIPGFLLFPLFWWIIL